MPNYAITSKYQPFSFQERITPLLMLQEKYDEVGEKLADFSDNSNAYYNYLDPKSRDVIDKYNETLNSVADSLSRDGLKAVSRNTLFDLKRMYNNQIAPINKAAENYASLQEQIRKAKIADPTLFVGNMPTVSDLMADPNAMPSTVSGATLYKQGTLAANQLQDVTYDQLNAYLAGDISAIPNIDSIALEVGGMNGIGNLTGKEQQQALGYIMQGMRDGLSARTAEMYAYNQKQDIQLQHDLAKIQAQTSASAYLDNLRTNNDIRAARDKAEITAKYKTSGGSGSGTSYTTQSNSTMYWKGDAVYDGEFQKDAMEEAMKDSKAEATTVYQLSDQNKRRALRLIGVPVRDTASGAELDSLIGQNLGRLEDYDYYEYIDEKRSKNNEFKRKPRKVMRDTGIPDYYGGESNPDYVED